MTKQDTGESPPPKQATREATPIRKSRKQGGGGVYIDGKRVGGTEPVETKPDPKRVAERKARRGMNNG